MTEEIAKTKWCPMVRHNEVTGTWNRTKNMLKRIFEWSGENPYPDESCNCIASDCMMWRNIEDPITISIVGGYCGLAGDRGLK